MGMSAGLWKPPAATLLKSMSNSRDAVASKRLNRKFHRMIKPISLIAVAIAALFAAPAAEARGCHSRNYVSYHRSCGGPAWVETYVAYYDSCGRAVLRTRVVPVRRHHRPVRPVCRPVPACRPMPHHRGGITVRIGSCR